MRQEKYKNVRHTNPCDANEQIRGVSPRHLEFVLARKGKRSSTKNTIDVCSPHVKVQANGRKLSCHALTNTNTNTKKKMQKTNRRKMAGFPPNSVAFHSCGSAAEWLDEGPAGGPPANRHACGPGGLRTAGGSGRRCSPPAHAAAIPAEPGVARRRRRERPPACQTHRPRRVADVW